MEVLPMSFFRFPNFLVPGSGGLCSHPNVKIITEDELIFSYWILGTVISVSPDSAYLLLGHVTRVCFRL